MNINNKQILSIILAVLGVLMVSTTQLNDLLGATTAKTVVSLAGLLNSILASALAIVSSQGGLIREVQAMPGVDKITVNAQANQTLAAAAVDPANAKIEAANSGLESVLAATAKGDA